MTTRIRWTLRALSLMSFVASLGCLYFALFYGTMVAVNCAAMPTNPGCREGDAWVYAFFFLLVTALVALAASFWPARRAKSEGPSSTGASPPSAGTR